MNIADFNGDGHADISLTRRLARSALLFGNGNGGFTDMTSRLPDDSAIESSSAAVGDVDGDGDADIFNVVTGAQGLSRLWRNDNGQFVDVTATHLPFAIDEPRRAKRRREARGSREAASAGVGAMMRRAGAHRGGRRASGAKGINVARPKAIRTGRCELPTEGRDTSVRFERGASHGHRWQRQPRYRADQLARSGLVVEERRQGRFQIVDAVDGADGYTSNDGRGGRCQWRWKTDIIVGTYFSRTHLFLQQ